MSETKTCNKCGLQLDLSEFSKRASGSLNARCKTCCRGAVRVQKACLVCGTTFPATDKSTKKFCSIQCKRKNDLNQQAEKQQIGRKTRLSERESQAQQNKKNFPEVFERFKHLPVSRADAIKKNVDLYFTGQKCKNDHLAPKRTKNRLCTSCAEERSKESYIRFKRSDRYEEWLKQSNENTKKRRAKDPDYRENVNIISKRWQAKNREHLNKYMRKQRKDNPQFAIRDRLQSRLNYVLRNNGEKKSDTLENYLGGSCKELANWIESQFVDGMSWENKETWNVDHIRPCASFDLTDEAQAKVCFNWRNLMPLGEFENKSKNDSYEPHDEVNWGSRMRELGYDGELFLLFEEGRGGL